MGALGIIGCDMMGTWGDMGVWGMTWGTGGDMEILGGDMGVLGVTWGY